MITIFKQQNTRRGYTLLFAVLVASLALAVGISILNLSKKEFLIATSARDSEAALYAADGGLECAIYVDNQQLFDATRAQNQPAQLNADFNKKCITQNSGITYASVNSKDTFTFQLLTGGEGNSCAVVTVRKWTDSVTGGLRTTVESRGYNTGWDPTTSTCSKSSAKKVERALSYNVY